MFGVEYTTKNYLRKQFKYTISTLVRQLILFVLKLLVELMRYKCCIIDECKCAKLIKKLKSKLGYIEHSSQHYIRQLLKNTKYSLYLKTSRFHIQKDHVYEELCYCTGMGLSYLLMMHTSICSSFLRRVLTSWYQLCRF